MISDQRMNDLGLLLFVLSGSEGGRGERAGHYLDLHAAASAPLVSCSLQ